MKFESLHIKLKTLFFYFNIRPIERRLIMTISVSDFYDPEDLYYEEDEWPDDDDNYTESSSYKEINIYYYDF